MDGHGTPEFGCQWGPLVLVQPTTFFFLSFLFFLLHLVYSCTHLTLKIRRSYLSLWSTLSEVDTNRLPKSLGTILSVIFLIKWFKWSSGPLKVHMFPNFRDFYHFFIRMKFGGLYFGSILSLGLSASAERRPNFIRNILKYRKTNELK